MLFSKIFFQKYYRSFFFKLNPSGYKNWKRRKMKKFYSQFIKPGGLCFDIGANKGLFSKTFLDAGSKVVAAEPIEENFDVLCENFSFNKDFIAVKAAISNTTGTTNIYKGRCSDLSSLDKSFLLFSEETLPPSQITQQPVELTTLDELIVRYGLPDFCKIDVEGHEKEILQGLSHVIPVVSFEYLHPFKERAIDCLKILDRLSPNARYNYSLFEFFELENRHWVDARTFIAILQQLPKSHWTADIFCKS